MRVGLIGAGNMGSAILKGAFKQNFLKPYECLAYDISEAQLSSLATQYPITMASSNIQLAKECECIIMAIKPIFMRNVLMELRPYVSGKNIISIAAGWTTDMLKDALGEENGAHILRVMPNTAALIGVGYSALCSETSFSPQMLDWAKQLFATLGVVQVLPERMFDAVLAVSSSGPAYAYMLIETMADGAVKYGMSRQLAQQAAAQAVLGAAKMVLDTGEHPATLKDNVCSPGGTTIEAVEMLEQKGFRGAVLYAMDACVQKNARLVEQPKTEGK